MAESELEQALDEAAEGNSRARRRVYELLAQASLYVEPARRPEPGGATLSTSSRVGGLEMAAFTSLAQTLARDMDSDIRWVHAPASWIFSEALRLGCAAVWINPPQCEIPRADFSALANGRVPEASSLIAAAPPAPAPAPAAASASVPEKPVPVSAPTAKPRLGAPAKAAPKILAPRGRIPDEAGVYLEIALASVNEIEAAYFFDLLMPGEKRMLCLGLRIDLPPARWEEFIAGIEQLADIPGFPDGVAACPLNDEMLAAAEKVGVQIL